MSTAFQKSSARSSPTTTAHIPRSRMKALIVAFGLVAAISPAAENPAVEAINHLGIATLRQSAGNTLVSPWSVQQSLAMVFAGARGKTATEMATALGYKGDPSALHEGFKQLREAMTAVAAPAEGIKAPQTANRLFVDRRVSLNADWLELVRKSYDAPPGVTDFSNPLVAEKAINEWVSGQTEKKIPFVIPAGRLTRQALLVVVNALYFDMPWDELFTKELTTTAPFFLSQGGCKMVPLMFKQHRQRYAHQDGYQIATVPYAGGSLQFVVILPDRANDLERIEARLTPQLLAGCATLPVAEIRLSLPRLKMEPAPVAMKDALRKLGMKTAFCLGADLTGIWHDGRIADPTIDEVFHRTFIELNEEGTKAAAATAAIIRPKNGHPHEVPHQVVRADHPFIFAIQHVPSGACLFIGRVVDPAPDTPVQPRPPAKK